MQTAKIIIGDVYAVKLYGGGSAVRFRVDAIVTRKESGKTFSSVEGREVGDDAQDRQKHTIDPKDILGDYTEFAELAAKAAAEKAAKEAVAKIKKDKASALVFELYKITGLTREKDEYRSPIRVEYNEGVTLRAEAVEALLSALKTRVAA